MSSSTATVCRSTRRYVDMYDEEFNLLRGTSADAVEALCVGDIVEFEQTENSQYLVTACQTRTNLLQRSSAAKTKILAANIDHLLIVTAPGGICRPQTIDRVLIAAAIEEIPVSLIWNKSDLEKEFTESKLLREVYLAAGYNIIESSAMSDDGITSLVAFLQSKELRHVVLTGVSGVGKSSLLNSLIDTADVRTQEVSVRGGHGRQTTSSAFGYPYKRDAIETLMLCDLPGVQQFGLAHLEEASIRNGYLEFAPYSAQCKFSNCSHLEEPECAVRTALEESKITDIRYNSYAQIVKEHRQLYN